MFYYLQTTELSKLETSLKRKFTDMNSTISDGPFFATLEECLKACKVKKQAYQGGTFVGNHVHKLLKVINSVLKMHLPNLFCL